MVVTGVVTGTPESHDAPVSMLYPEDDTHPAGSTVLTLVFPRPHDNPVVLLYPEVEVHPEGRPVLVVLVLVVVFEIVPTETESAPQSNELSQTTITAAPFPSPRRERRPPFILACTMFEFEL